MRKMMDPNDFDQQDQKKLVPNSQARWQKVKDKFYSKGPYNCIGLVSTVSSQKGEIIGNGFLISRHLIVTSAHLIYSFHKNEIIQFTPDKFYHSVNGKLDEKDEKKSTDIVSYEVCPQYLQILKANKKLVKQLAVLKSQNTPENQQLIQNLKVKTYQLKKQSQKYDYALLATEKIIKRDAYFKLFTGQHATLRDEIVTICGYLKFDHDYQLCEGSNNAQITLTGMNYDIDTKQGQSGTPVFLSIQKLTVVGIHKGHDSSLNRNVCTLVSKQMLQNFQEWSKKFQAPITFFGGQLIQQQKSSRADPNPITPMQSFHSNQAKSCLPEEQSEKTPIVSRPFSKAKPQSFLIEPGYQLHPDNRNHFDVKVQKTKVVVKHKFEDNKFHSYILNGHIPQEGISSYKIKQANTKMQTIYTGIATRSAFGKTNVHNGKQVNVVLYSSRKGAVIVSGQEPMITNIPVQNGSDITLEVDYAAERVSWRQVKRQLATVDIPKQMRHQYLYLIVVMLHKDDTIQILDI